MWTTVSPAKMAELIEMLYKEFAINFTHDMKKLLLTIITLVTRCF